MKKKMSVLFVAVLLFLWRLIFLGVCFSCSISVNGERPIPIFDLVSQVFLCLFLVLGGKRHKRGVEIHIYPCF